MRTTISIDDELLAAASAALVTDERAMVLHEGLPAIVQRAAARRLARLGGSDGMSTLPSEPMATRQEVLAFVERHVLFGRGIGWVDAHLLVSTVLAGGTTLWRRDRKSGRVAGYPGLGALPH